MDTHEGSPVASDRRFAVVASRFNPGVVRRLEEACLAALRGKGVREDRITWVRVPGAFEIPLAARRLAASGRYAAVIALGAVIRGETTHYDLISREAAAGLSSVMRDTGIPCAFGVLTTETEDQALDRSGPGEGNKGAEAALVALEMADLLPRLGPDAPKGGN